MACHKKKRGQTKVGNTTSVQDILTWGMVRAPKYWDGGDAAMIGVQHVCRRNERCSVPKGTRNANKRGNKWSDEYRKGKATANEYPPPPFPPCAIVMAEA